MKITDNEDSSKYEYSLTFDEIKAEEGIYEPEPIIKGEINRIIVVKDSTQTITSVLYYDVRNRTLQAAQPSWGGAKFRKTNEELSMKLLLKE